MDLNISSEKIGNPLLVELLKKLTECFGSIEQTFFVIGATARDIIMLQVANTEPNRKTRDLDVAIAIPDWPTFDRIKAKLEAEGFRKDTKQYQRFYYKDYELDIVPYGEVAKTDDRIYWPPEEEIAMSVKGFDNVLSDAITVHVDGEFELKIASLHGLFLLKFNAWQDRHLTTDKDAEDMSFILSNYFTANLERGIHPEVYKWESFDLYNIGSYWLAYDLAELLNKSQLLYYSASITDELNKEESSLLINQILEHDSKLKYGQVRNAWQRIADVFREVADRCVI